jgi:branched-chain amino acid transport system permease protein
MSEPLLVVEQGSKQHRQWQAAGWFLIGAIVLMIPVVLQSFELGKMNRALVLGIAVLAVNLVVGFNGMLALGHSAFMGLGAFIAASLVQNYNWDYWMAIPVVAIVGFIVGVIVGLPALRVKGLYLALTTIAMATVFPGLVNLEIFFRHTGGPNGKGVSEEVEPPGYLQWLPGTNGSRGDAAYRYWIIVLMVALTMLLVRNMIRSRPGRAVIAIRDNEAGAAVYGVNVPMYKTINFGVSAAIGATAGLMYAVDKSFVAGQDFTFLLAVDLIIGLVIGGVGTLQGSLLGGLFVVWVTDLTRRVAIPLGFYTLDGDGPLSKAIFGLILILFTFFAPGGMVSLIRLVKIKVIRILPLDPDGTPVALVADLDPGEGSTRAQSAMKLSVIGPVLCAVGWLAMNINSLLVGALAFAMRTSLIFIAPLAMIVGLNELAALKDGKRSDSSKGPATMAVVLGGLGTLFVIGFGLWYFFDGYIDNQNS